MFALAQVTFLDHSGGVGDPKAVFQLGSPERLKWEKKLTWINDSTKEAFYRLYLPD